MTNHAPRTVASVILAFGGTLLLGTSALAEDPTAPKKPPARPQPAGKSPPAAPSKEPVALTASPKAGTVFRFRQSEESSTEVNGKPYGGTRSRHEYTVTVGAVAAGGGFTGKLKVDRAVVRIGGDGGKEIDSANPPAERPTDLKERMISLLAQGMTSAEFEVTVGPDGRLTGVKGFREALEPLVKGTLLERMLDQIASPEESVKAFGALFASLPEGTHAPDAEWQAAVADQVGGQNLDFDATLTLALPAADRALVSSKLVWKPGEKATAGGAKTEGGGTVSGMFGRPDGLPIRYEKKLFANRTTDTMKATSHTDVTIERLNADGAPAAPADVGKSDAPKPDAPESDPKTSDPKKPK